MHVVTFLIIFGDRLDIMFIVKVEIPRIITFVL